MTAKSIHRLTALASRRRTALEGMLGGVCWACGSTGPLHFDHPYGRDYQPRLLSSHQRMKRYAQDAAEGRLRLLCWSHNESREYNGVYLPPPPGAVLERVPLEEKVQAEEPF